MLSEPHVFTIAAALLRELSADVTTPAGKTSS